MLSTGTPLSTNGLVMPPDFPAADYEAVYKQAVRYSGKLPDVWEHFAGAWNAVAYRFLALTEYEATFTRSIAASGSPPPAERYQQERDLFGFFSNGFAVFEAAFYALFSVGALVSPTQFPIATAKDQQRISPSTASAAVAKAFPGDPIQTMLDAVLQDAEYLEWREVRNVLTHRAAPGRIFFASLGSDEQLPDQWKIKNIVLDGQMAPTRRASLSRLLTAITKGMEQFVQSRL